MKRTRKWEFVKQEAARLATLGLPVKEIAARISVNRTNIARWMDAGKIADTRRAARAENASKASKVNRRTKAAEWAKAIRDEYQLDATDDQLVSLAEAALRMSHDPLAKQSERLNAMGRFQALVKQLQLVARFTESALPAPAPPQTAPVAAPARPQREPQQTPAVDPRRALMTVVK